MLDTDILIVGAGPVGLFLANECLRRGIRHRIVETRATQSVNSKALAVFPRTLEIFDMAGVVAPFLEAANRVTSVSVITHGRRLAHMPFTPEESPYPFIAMIPQNVTENLLVGELRRKGGSVEYETTCVDVIPQQDSVLATLDHKGQTSTVRAAFVVGCDGAHSKMRHIMGLTLEGGEYDSPFMLADIESNDALPADELQLCPSELGPIAVFPMSPTRRRLVGTVDQPEGDAPTLEMVRKILAQRGPGNLEARALHWSSYFRIHHRHAPKLRVGRMFLAGDAAHIHSPFGGQGMNTGLHDIWNLVWKLDLFLRGHGNERLLDSYTLERVPIIKNVIDTTDFLTKVMGTPSRFVQALRNTVIPMVSRLAPFQHAFVQRMSELGIDYHGSPIVEGPGKRYLDDSMRGGRGIGSRFLMTVDKDQDEAGAEELAGAFGDVLELRALEQHGIKLVRPDGYLAYASHSRSALDSVKELLERQTV